MLQALESTADQIDRLAEIIDECLTLAESGVPMSATTRQRYAAKMAEHITDGVIASTPDFASLLTTNPTVRTVLSEGGYGPELKALDRAIARSSNATTVRARAGARAANPGTTLALLRSARRIGRARQHVVREADPPYGDLLGGGESGTLHTGEIQSRLPEAGAVRDQNVQTPEIAEVPFALDPTTSKARKGRQNTLFENAPAYETPAPRS